jgi:hypothetical protein
MTVFRALRGAVCAVLVLFVPVLFELVPLHPGRVSAADSAVETPAPTPGGSVPATVLVASGAPIPGAAVADAPRVGPLDAGVGGARGHGVWWLFGLGALQVVGLFVMTRRRARLSTPDVAS